MNIYEINCLEFNLRQTDIIQLGSSCAGVSNIIHNSLWIWWYRASLNKSVALYVTLMMHETCVSWRWRHQRETFSHYWPFVWGIPRSPVNSSHKGQWRRALMFSLTWAWTNGWVNNRDAGDLRRHSAHFDVSVMLLSDGCWSLWYIYICID